MPQASITVSIPGSNSGRGTPHHEALENPFNAASVALALGGGPGEANTGSGSRTPSKRSHLLSADTGAPGRKHQKLQQQGDEESVLGPRKTKVVVKECEYATYFAVLYYVSLCHQPARGSRSIISKLTSLYPPLQLYTDTIVFSPLTSDFLTRPTLLVPPTTPGGTALPSNTKQTQQSPSSINIFPQNSNTGQFTFNSPAPPSITIPAAPPPISAQPTSPWTNAGPTLPPSNPNPPRKPPRNSSGNNGNGGNGGMMNSELGEAVHRSRREWVRAWMAANPGRPAPCSAKACYRLADSQSHLFLLSLLIPRLTPIVYVYQNLV